MGKKRQRSALSLSSSSSSHIEQSIDGNNNGCNTNKRSRTKPPASSDKKDSSSNLLLGPPKVGMKVEICDPDNIWSSAKIIKVTRNKNSKSHKVLIRYDGWGDEWDETITFENNERLVPNGTYTKRLKCMVDLFPKRGKNCCTLWPCIVNVRSPSPLVSLDEYGAAEQFLMEEPKVFIQPYGLKENYLPGSFYSSSTIDGGRWINIKHIRKWKSETKSIEGKLLDNFNLAFDIAERDQSVPDTLPSAAFDKGSLINAKYRIKPQGHPDEQEEIKEETKQEAHDEISISSTGSISQSKGLLITDTSADNTLVYHAPPVLPAALNIDKCIYPGSKITKSTMTGKWIASCTKNGNDIILGSFTTQFEAHEAIQAATSSISNQRSDFKPSTSNDTVYNRIQDMKNLSLSSVISMASQQSNRLPQHNFSLHEWTVQHTQHKGYQLEKLRITFEELKRQRKSSISERRKR
jgi:hypothetical protein